LTEIKSDCPEWTSFHRLVQELIGGAVRRHTFTQWELELLLDLQTARLRKSSRSGVLRKYARTVQKRFSEGAPEPPRLALFLSGHGRGRAAASGGK